MHNRRNQIQAANGILELFFAVIIIVGAISMIVPFLWMVSASLKTNLEFYDAHQFFPKSPQFNNYLLLFSGKNTNFLIYFFNSVKVTALFTFGALLSCSLTAFALARIGFPGSKQIFSFALVSMFLPPQVTMIPVFIMFNKIGWYDTHWPLIIRGFFGIPFGIFLLRQFFKTIPRDIEDAAKIDGCSWFKIYYRIALPLIKPALITLAIMQFQVKWGEILQPLIYLSKNELYTLTMGLRQLTQHQYETDYATQMAGYVLLIAPVMIIYIICQKYFTQSITSAGLKG